MKTVPSPIVAGRGVNKATTFTVVSPKPVPAIPPRLEELIIQLGIVLIYQVF